MVQIGHFSRKLKMAIAAWSAPLCAGLAGNHGVSFTAISSLKVANACYFAAMDACGVRARMAPSSRDAGVGLPFRPMRSQRSGDQEPHSYDSTACLTPELNASARYLRLCGAQRPRNVNFSNLGKLLVAEAAGVQRRKRPGNTMIVRALARMGTPDEPRFIPHRASGVGAGMRALTGLYCHRDDGGWGGKHQAALISSPGARTGVPDDVRMPLISRA